MGQLESGSTHVHRVLGRASQSGLSYFQSSLLGSGWLAVSNYYFQPTLQFLIKILLIKGLRISVWCLPSVIAWPTLFGSRIPGSGWSPTPRPVGRRRSGGYGASTRPRSFSPHSAVHPQGIQPRVLVSSSSRRLFELILSRSFPFWPTVRRRWPMRMSVRGMCALHCC